MACAPVADRAEEAERGPSPAPDAIRFKALTSGNFFTCGVSTDERLWCWGLNDYGQLAQSDLEDRLVPVEVRLPVRLRHVVAGDARVCGPDTTAVLWCWGDNVAQSMQQPDTLMYAPPDSMRVGSVLQVASGSRFTCATTPDRIAQCWGGNRYGELGDAGDSLAVRAIAMPVAEPIRFDTLVAGRLHACGLDAQQRAYCWGAAGLVGNGAPDKVRTPAAVAGGHRFRTLTAGHSVTCGLTAAGVAWCWGLNHDGQLGNAALRGNPFTPVAVDGAHTFVQLAAGFHRVCGLDTDGVVWCWGSNFGGGLGDSTVKASSPTPVAVRTHVRFSSLSAGDTHACALDADGFAWCWGMNSRGSESGALGDGTRVDRAQPAPVAPPLTTSAATRTRTRSSPTVGSTRNPTVRDAEVPPGPMGENGS